MRTTTLKVTTGLCLMLFGCGQSPVEGVEDAGIARAAEGNLDAGLVGPRPCVFPAVEDEAGARAGWPDGKELIYGWLDQGELAVADEMLEDRWDLGPRYPGPSTLGSLTWTEDPYRDAYWRFLFYSLRPTRHLLWAYETTGDRRYLDKLLGILDSYARHDRSRPAAYDRSRFDNRHTAAFRAMVLVNAWVKLSRISQLPGPLAALLRTSIAKLGKFLADPANFEEDHNHGFTEAAALAIIGLNFPDLKGAAQWVSLAHARLDQLMVDAVDDDGVEVENSPFYHFYVLSAASELVRWARANDVGLSEHFESRARSMLRYATHITMPNGRIPLLGASVTARVSRLDPTLYRGLAESEPEFCYVYTDGAMGVPPKERAVLFPISGQSMLRSGFGDADAPYKSQTYVTFNVGPWRTNHSHRDVLGITLYASGAVMLPDSGLFTYEPGEDFDYFDGTSAHNTVVVDGLSQSTAKKVGHGSTLEGPGWAYQSGWHQLYAGVSHKRSVLLLERDLVVVIDRLEAKRSHRYAQTWHLAPGLDASVRGTDIEAVDERGRVQLRLLSAPPADLPAESVRVAPPTTRRGWYSEVYEKKDPITSIENPGESARGRRRPCGVWRHEGLAGPH